PVRLKRATRSATVSNALMSHRGARAGSASPSALDVSGRSLLGEVLTCSGDIISAVQPASPLISHRAHDAFVFEPAKRTLGTASLARRFRNTFVLCHNRNPSLVRHRACAVSCNRVALKAI